VRLIRWLIFFPVLLAAILFAVSNRDLVSIAFWPFINALWVPLYLAVLISLVAGFLLGGLVVWIGGARVRREHRHRGRRINALERERHAPTPGAG